MNVYLKKKCIFFEGNYCNLFEASFSINVAIIAPTLKDWLFHPDIIIYVKTFNLRL
jgi:hypothetical protein